MVTIKEIAKQCGVSATTVSNILNGKAKASKETCENVLQVVKDMGYQPNFIARGLRQQKTYTIGIIAEDIAQFTTPPIIEGIMKYCEEQQYQTIVKNLRLYARWSDSWFNDVEKCRSVLQPVLRELHSVKVDGIIYLAGHARNIRCMAEDFQVPAVMAYAYSNTSGIPSVVLDDQKSSYDMVRYLLDKGHTCIGVIGGRADNIHTQKRLLGYQQALCERGMMYHTELIQYGDWTRQSGYQQMTELMERAAEEQYDYPITAVYCMSDRMAGGVYDYLEEHHLQVGRDIAVAGFDNQEIAEYFRPALTTMSLPLYEIGHQSAELLLQQMAVQDENKSSRSEYRIPCSLIERESVLPRNKQEEP